MAKEYLGDGVYVELVSGALLLTTENGREVTNSIVLEPTTWENLETYVRQLKEDIKERARPEAWRGP